MKAYVFQDVLAPDFERPKDLYFSDPENAPGCLSELPWQLDEGQVLSTDTFFNALYLPVWHHFATIGRIGLNLGVDGPVKVEIFSRRAETTSLLYIGEIQCDSVIWLDTLPEDAARLFCRISAIDRVLISALSWVTDTPPRHNPSLAIGLCTYNREQLLLGTVEALTRQCALTPEITCIRVVNQGAKFTDPRFVSLVGDYPVEIIEQSNLGGCGGFARSMFEALSSEPEPSHLLLMDDDIVLDPRVLNRVVGFLRYCDPQIAVGGQMLEIERPRYLHEAGGKLDPIWYVVSIGEGHDMRKQQGLSLFDEPMNIDYNAWWFCVIPTAAIQKVGLPPPLFIRGDDIEYGCRLAEAGISTVPLPGCAVWHESFAFKTSNWLLYYDLRNRLLLSWLYPERVTPPDALYLFGYVLSVLFQHRYRATAAAIKAIEDALAPPWSVLGADPAKHHAELLDWLETLPKPETIPPEDLPVTKSGVSVPLDPSVPAMVRMCVVAFVGQHFLRLMPRKRPVRFKQVPPAPAISLLREYIAPADPNAKRYERYKNDLGQMWSLLFRALLICLRYQRHRRKAASRLRSNIDELRATDVWKTKFYNKG